MEAAGGFVPGRHLIESYGSGGFRFAGMSHRGSILALPSGVRSWAGADAASLAAADFCAVIAEAAEIDLLLIGTGNSMMPLARQAVESLRDANLRFEVMSTDAAARTYNVLVSENRKAAACLLAVQ